MQLGPACELGDEAPVSEGVPALLASSTTVAPAALVAYAALAAAALVIGRRGA
ncbi:hypothetical protein HDA32_001752 [Spinactinospora alkalitolerans]|uniref:Uncharacterized protein n=1 Tax=Spinactinospora alkalitolerans TaxID=687207 RepID=A0A852TUT4_9ACTN|nr:hypothetical protein [Spinactinospora alkalitolerans]NYE46632.1 hypothetical protein [Spinactinospora alkalitolerans]